MNRSTAFRFNRIVIICCMALCLFTSYLFDADFISLRLDMAIVSKELDDNVIAQFTETVAPDYTRQNNSTTFPWLSIL
ncbi:MAG: hypothetical protein K2L34_07115, partial [Muribaculaceae bacterium]|nr:hypothetical protein [Muribaculaceae bacterium]